MRLNNDTIIMLVEKSSIYYINMFSILYNKCQPLCKSELKIKDSERNWLHFTKRSNQTICALMGHDITSRILFHNWIQIRSPSIEMNSAQSSS